MKEEDSNPNNKLSKIISFNVGGKIFQCFSSTLLKNKSLLSQMVCGIINTSKLMDKEGNIYLNRSPNGFEFILNCLRQNLFNIILKNTTKQKIEFYEKEIEFYELDYLIKINKYQTKNKSNQKNHYKKRKRSGKSKKNSPVTKSIKISNKPTTNNPGNIIFRPTPQKQKRKNLHFVTSDYNPPLLSVFIIHEDILMGYLSSVLLMCSIHISLNLLGYLSLSVPNYFLKYFLGFGPIVHFGIMSFHEINHIRLGYNWNPEPFYCCFLSIAGSYATHMLETKIRMDFLNIDYTSWGWVIYPYCKP
eukprot:gene11204-4024_t